MINVKKADMGLEKLASLYNQALGIDAGELVRLAKERAKADGCSETDALHRVVKESGRKAAVIVPLTGWREQVRTVQDGKKKTTTYTARCAVFDLKDKSVDVRTIRAYPDVEGEVMGIQKAKVGTFVKPDNMWPLKTRAEEAEIADDSVAKKGILAIKRVEEVKDIKDFATDANADKVAVEYCRMFGVKDKPRETFTRLVERLVGKGDPKFRAVAKAIAHFETTNLIIFGVPRIPRKTEKQEGQRERKPRLETIGLVERRGQTFMNELTLYFDAEEEAATFKAKHKVPMKATANNVFELRMSGGDDDEERGEPMIDALGHVKLGIRGLHIEKEGDEVRKTIDYDDVLDICDQKNEKFIPPTDMAAGQAVEFYNTFKLPLVVIDGETSDYDEKRNLAVLRVIVTDGERAVAGFAYGETAIDFVGADSGASFKSAVEKLHQGVVKDVEVFGARTWSKDEKSGEPVFRVTMNSIFGYKDATDADVAKVSGQ